MPRSATVLRSPGDTFGDGAPERRPGEFARNQQGAPWVTDPTKLVDAKLKKAELMELCARHGINWRSDLDIDPGKTPTVPQLKTLLGDLAKRGSKVLYGRPSSLGKQIENTTNLQKWAERAVALGLYLDHEHAVDHNDLLTELAGELFVARAAADLDDEAAKDILDAIAVKAKNRARAGIAAERGTHGHELAEDYDNEADFVERITRGEELGLPPEVQYALVAAWAKMLGQLDVEMLAVEATCVDDVWRQAGTLDRICRLKRDTRFLTTAGTYVTLPAGWVGILDIKTGRLRLDDGGFVSSWHGYAVQLASYAQSVPYDPDTDTRGEWPFEIDQQWAIIAHLDILAALDGEARCRLVLVDLEAGRHAGALCVAAREWERRRDVFSIPTDDLCVSVPVEPIAAPSTPPDVEQPAGEATTDASSAEIAHTHEWQQVGRCVYCKGCGMRYQGKAPSTANEAEAISDLLDAVQNKNAAREVPHVLAADVQPAPGAAAPGAMTDDEAREAYSKLDDDTKRKVITLRDEHIRKEAFAGRIVTKAQATKLALGWVAPFDRPTQPQTRCSSCGAAIIWAVTINDKRIPLDVEPTAGGNMVLVDGVARIPQLGEEQPFLMYVSHFATCPNADQHRKRDKAPPRFTGDEGPPISEAEANTARGWIEALSQADPEAFAEVRLVAKQAADAGVGFNIIAKPTRRRFEIYRGLAALARYSWSDELARDLLAAVTGDDACRQPGIPLGQIVGLLDDAQAAEFADLATRLERGSVGYVVTADGVTFPALAAAGSAP